MQKKQKHISYIQWKVKVVAHNLCFIEIKALTKKGFRIMLLI